MSGRSHSADWHESRQTPSVAFQSAPKAARPPWVPPSTAARQLLALLRLLTTRRFLLTLSFLSIVVWLVLASRAIKLSGTNVKLPVSVLPVDKDNASTSGGGRGREVGRRGSSWQRSSRTVLRPRTSLWLPQYRNFTGERCDRILQGDVIEQRQARDFRLQHGASFWCYRDHLLANASCSRLLRAATAASGLARYPAAATIAGAANLPQTNFFSSSSTATSSSSFSSAAYEPLPEERDFPLAFALRVHTCATQVELLLRAIYAPHNFYCLHADGGAAPEFLAAVRRLAQCLPNVILAPVRNDFVYKSASQMEADVECMDAALRSPIHWRYFINMAGQELPLRSNYELVRRLQALNGSSHVNVMQSRSYASRYAYARWCRDTATNLTVKCRPPLSRKSRPPGGARIHKSSAYGLYSRALVVFMREPGGLGRRLYDWFSDTMCPEEHYFATVASLPQAPGGYAAGSRTRAVQWRGSSRGQCRSAHYVRGVCIFDASDLPALIASGHAIANKFYFHKDPVAVRCLVDSIMRQKSDPRRRLLQSPLPPPLWLTRHSAAGIVQRSVLFGSKAGGATSSDAVGAARKPHMAIIERNRPEKTASIAKKDEVVRAAAAPLEKAAKAYYREANVDVPDDQMRPEADNNDAGDNNAEEAVEEEYDHDADEAEELTEPEDDSNRAGENEAGEELAAENVHDDVEDEAAASQRVALARNASQL